MRTVVFSLLVFTCSVAVAQELRTDVSYKYMFAGKWDKAVQTYNFSRPFLEHKQPLLKHGLNASVSYIFKSPNYFNQGLTMSYSYFRSSAENINLNSVLNLHVLNIGYILSYSSDEKTKGLYADAIMSLVSGRLNRTINGLPIEDDGAKVRALAIGGELSMKAGYCLSVNDKISFSPYALIGYAPYIYSPYGEAVINQTKGLVHGNWTGMITAQIGLSVHIM